MTRDHIQNVLGTIFKKVFDQGQADLMLDFFLLTEIRAERFVYRSLQ